MITPARPAALIIPDQHEGTDHEAAESRAKLRIYAGLGLLAVGFGLAGWAAIAQAWVAVIAMLVITAAGLIAIITGSTRRVDIGNRQRHDELRAAFANLTAEMMGEFGDLHREVRIIEQRQTEFDHRQDKMDDRQDDLDRDHARTVAEVNRLRREVAELAERVPVKPPRQPRQPPRKKEDPPALPPKKYMTDVAEAFRLGQQIPQRPPEEV